MPSPTLSQRSSTLYMGLQEVNKFPVKFGFFSKFPDLLTTNTNAGKFTVATSGTATTTLETTGLPNTVNLSNETYSSKLLETQYPLTVNASGSVLKVVTTAVTSGVTLTGRTFDWSKADFFNFLFKVSSLTPVYTITFEDDALTPKTAVFSNIGATNYGLEVDKMKRLVLSKSQATIASGFNWNAVKTIKIVSDVATTFYFAEIQTASDPSYFIGFKNDILISCINGQEISDEKSAEDVLCGLNPIAVSPSERQIEMTLTLAYYSPALSAAVNSTLVGFDDLYDRVNLNKEYNLTFTTNGDYAEIVIPQALNLKDLTISINGPSLRRADSLTSIDTDSLWFGTVSGNTTTIKTHTYNNGLVPTLDYYSLSSKVGVVVRDALSAFVSGEMMMSSVDSTGKHKLTRFPKVYITGYTEQREEALTTYELTARVMQHTENGKPILMETSFV